jgi:hypothetical protein
VHERVAEGIAVFDERDRPRERAALTGAHAGGQLLERPRAARHGR